jgi:ssRNA-specific RNase YbeY (16S rRNA maturation enzyme)
MNKEQNIRFGVRFVHENNPSGKPDFAVIEVNSTITVSEFIETVRKEFKIQNDENVILFVDDQEIRSLNQKFCSIANQTSNITIKLAQKMKGGDIFFILIFHVVKVLSHTLSAPAQSALNKNKPLPKPQKHLENRKDFHETGELHPNTTKKEKQSSKKSKQKSKNTDKFFFEMMMTMMI